jgi:hypothetical protein
MKQYNERTLANYNLSFDLFCLAVSKDCALKRQLDQINELKQELEHMKHCHRSVSEKLNEYKTKYEAVVPLQPKQEHTYKFQQPGYVSKPVAEPQADGIQLVDHWGSDEADELRECLRYHARNILDRAQKLAKLKELTDEDSMDMSNKLYDVAQELADSLKVQFSESVEKQIVEKQVDLLEADISALYEQQADDLQEP